MDRIRLSKNISYFIFFVMTFIFFVWLYSIGSMTSISGDANDIWKTISTWYEQDTYVSYVLYKGFAAVYPYVWFYKLAMFLGINEFTFVMLYHAMLFSYIVVFGIPKIIKELTSWEPKWWQVMLMSFFFFWAWKGSNALQEIMVDLPSCATFVLSINCALNIRKAKNKWIWGILAGILTAISTELSGQYLLAGLCVFVLAIFYNFLYDGSRKQKIFGLFALVVSFMLIKIVGYIFDNIIIMNITNGIGISSGTAWMERGLIYMINIPRMNDLHSTRGDALLWSIYGKETGNELWELSQAGGYAWTIKEYLQIVLRYPLDFILQYVDRFFLCLSIDTGVNAFHSLFIGYALVYMSVLTIVKQNSSCKMLFRLNNLIIFSALLSVVPVLVLSVEPRYALGLQSVFFGIAICGPCVPRFISRVITNLREHKKLQEYKFPWHFLLGLLFCLLCIAFYNSFFCQSDLDVNKILMNW